MLGITLEFLSKYHEALFTKASLSFYRKIIFKFLNLSKINGRIQTNTIKTRSFFHDLLHFNRLPSMLSYLIFKLECDPIIHGIEKQEVKRIFREKNKGLE